MGDCIAQWFRDAPGTTAARQRDFLTELRDLLRRELPAPRSPSLWPLRGQTKQRLAAAGDRIEHDLGLLAQRGIETRCSPVVPAVQHRQMLTDLVARHAGTQAAQSLGRRRAIDPAARFTLPLGNRLRFRSCGGSGRGRNWLAGGGSGTELPATAEQSAKDLKHVEKSRNDFSGSYSMTRFSKAAVCSLMASSPRTPRPS